MNSYTLMIICDPSKNNPPVGSPVQDIIYSNKKEIVIGNQVILKRSEIETNSFLRTLGCWMIEF